MNIKTYWQKLSGKSWVIALLDLVLLAMAVYIGYAVRLGIVIPRYVEDWIAVMGLMPAVCVAVFWAEIVTPENVTFAVSV